MSGALLGIVATSGSNAWAVGYADGSTGANALIARWNGAAWK